MSPFRFRHSCFVLKRSFDAACRCSVQTSGGHAIFVRRSTLCCAPTPRALSLPLSAAAPPTPPRPAHLQHVRVIPKQAGPVAGVGVDAEVGADHHALSRCARFLQAGSTAGSVKKRCQLSRQEADHHALPCRACLLQVAARAA